ncbi:hypothetical protein [Ramlibacter sp. WS9]|uniref:hypothetical protein n=1 Tax=Ramlibacter sp. WS9 TaxID=1882741 RepID=UPI0011436365|nr:hypothetical protein [Ramlibacter sp. WS9]ROZ78869.1 hypothetical protein EEB15_04055 [Ramlibacter sp. WS9]
MRRFKYGFAAISVSMLAVACGGGDSKTELEAPASLAWSEPQAAATVQGQGRTPELKLDDSGGLNLVIPWWNIGTSPGPGPAFFSVGHWTALRQTLARSDNWSTMLVLPHNLNVKDWTVDATGLSSVLMVDPTAPTMFAQLRRTEAGWPAPTLVPFAQAYPVAEVVESGVGAEPQLRPFVRYRLADGSDMLAVVEHRPADGWRVEGIAVGPPDSMEPIALVRGKSGDAIVLWRQGSQLMRRVYDKQGLGSWGPAAQIEGAHAWRGAALAVAEPGATFLLAYATCATLSGPCNLMAVQHNPVSGWGPSSVVAAGVSELRVRNAGIGRNGHAMVFWNRASTRLTNGGPLPGNPQASGPQAGVPPPGHEPVASLRDPVAGWSLPELAPGDAFQVQIDAAGRVTTAGEATVGRYVRSTGWQAAPPPFFDPLRIYRQYGFVIDAMGGVTAAWSERSTDLHSFSAGDPPTYFFTARLNGTTMSPPP